MTTAERLAELRAIHERLSELLTDTEADTYPAIEHLSDLIDDLTD